MVIFNRLHNFNIHSWNFLDTSDIGYILLKVFYSIGAFRGFMYFFVYLQLFIRNIRNCQTSDDTLSGSIRIENCQIRRPTNSTNVFHVSEMAIRVSNDRNEQGAKNIVESDLPPSYEECVEAGKNSEKYQ